MAAIRAHTALLVVAQTVSFAPAGAQTARSADEHVEASLRTYADDDAVTVVSPAAAAHVLPADDVAIDANVTVDVVTAASVDVITHASPATVHETRVELGATAAWSYRPTAALRLGAIGSRENDYLSLRVTGGWRGELARRNTTLDLAYTAAFDRVTHAVDDEFSEARSGHQLTGTVTQLLDRRTYVDVVVDASAFTGYHANAYRTVPIIDSSTTELRRVPERVPELRAGGAALVRVRRALGDTWFARASYRLYADDWSVVSHTAELAVVTAPRWRDALVSVSARGYTQSAASFYRAAYVDDEPEYVTRDRTLGGMRSAHVGVTGELALGPARVGATLGAARFWFLDFPAQARRTAAIGGVAVTVPF